MSDSYLTQHSLDKLQKYVMLTKKKDEDRREKDLEARLGQNLERAIANPVVIGQHRDDRATILHPARFLPGAAVPLETSWLEARKRWGREPAEAVAEFDLLALGLPGCLSPRMGNSPQPGLEGTQHQAVHGGQRGQGQSRHQDCGHSVR
jgi:hypothetical protein